MKGFKQSGRLNILQLTNQNIFLESYNQNWNLQKPVQSQLNTEYIIQNRKKSKLPLAFIIVSILIIIMMGITLILPWYAITYVDKYSNRSQYRYSFTNIEFEEEDNTESMSWDDLDSVENQRNLYTSTMILTFIGLVMGSLFLISGLRLMKGKSKNHVIIFGVLTVIFCFLPLIIFTGMHSSVLKMDNEDIEGNGPWDSFAGWEAQFSHREGLVPSDFEHTELGWGPHSGWSFSIITVILAILGLILAIKIPKLEIKNKDQTSPEQLKKYNKQYESLYGKSPPQQNSLQQNLCGDCQTPLTYIPQNQRWYCDYCKKYV